ncbi:RNA-binding protein with serine-rich domain like [Quillaja saponaria]|uniref:RNA-binding protein with serine-rich domain like n=1 Tax=Quillaja saponaria TaxID=32244 RepID=A0AAD7KPQ8_QUISA|nr:RNA-binding protein with serine-rich domain like [Quillaja saponaria]
MFVPAKRLSSSSSSSDSSSDDLFQVDAFKATQSRGRTNSIYQDAQLKDEHALSDRISKSEEADHRYPGPTLTSQVSDVTHEQMVYGMSPTQTPPTQVMERPGGYDPHRIPSSVFERSKSLTPMEWSIASNESLFSIYVGNNSFSTDHVLMLGEFEKSGELTKSGELIMMNPAPAVSMVDTDTARNGVEMEVPEATGVTDKPFKEARLREAQTEPKRQTLAVTWSSFKASTHSDGSEISAHSFAFPAKKSGCPSCYCCNCSWEFCYCWKCSQKRRCCHSSPILTGEERSASVKAELEQQRSEKKPSAVSSSSFACHSFSCFSCCKWGSCCRWRRCCC